ncbi:MAG: imidazole glycerol phosphate synthase subunit HisH [Deltaproteobacteria bacterium]|nr:imidazole glycerol phosphate synthase subunit HisH [Deltaproteobacteria bacterium]
MIAIIDYGAGNLRSVVNAVSRLGYEAKVVNSPEEVISARVVILPGVGAAADTMANLQKTGLDSAVKRYVAEGRPFLGVCIGMQVLFGGTEEGGWHECLGVIPGAVRKFAPGLKVPHMGWNQVKQKIAHPIFEGIPDEANFYFVHSYYVKPEDGSLVAGETEYGIPFCSVVAKDNLVATQFHPEKSGEAGLKVYDNFIRVALGARAGRR